MVVWLNAHKTFTLNSPAVTMIKTILGDSIPSSDKPLEQIILAVSLSG